MVAFWKDWCRYPIYSIEDGFAERRLGRVENANWSPGPPHSAGWWWSFVTNVDRLQTRHRRWHCQLYFDQSKPRSALTETINSVNLATKHAYTSVISHRLAKLKTPPLPTRPWRSTGQIKTGSASRSDGLPNTTNCWELKRNWVTPQPISAVQFLVYKQAWSSCTYWHLRFRYGGLTVFGDPESIAQYDYIYLGTMPGFMPRDFDTITIPWSVYPTPVRHGLPARDPGLQYGIRQRWEASTQDLPNIDPNRRVLSYNTTTEIIWQFF